RLLRSSRRSTPTASRGSRASVSRSAPPPACVSPSGAGTSVVPSPSSCCGDARGLQPPLRLKFLQMPLEIQLTPRQQDILRRLVEEFVASGQPFASKTPAEKAHLDAGPSTVRAVLAELESLVLLTHPHTSAGRVPT